MPTTTSSPIYVWAWLPRATSPIPVGALEQRGRNDLWFRYGNRYLDRPDAISLYEPAMPLSKEPIGPFEDLHMPAPIRDASPDAWGRRVILNQLTGNRGGDAETDDLTEATYLTQSGSNRFGAIDFQDNPVSYVPREHSASLDDLIHASDLVEAGLPLPAELHAAALSGTVMGGARPKATITEGQIQYLAKFTTSTDTFPAVGAEAAAIHLARLAGIEVPEFRMEHALGKDVLLIERFDRTPAGGRRLAVSGLTMLGLGEMAARYGSYPDLLDVLRVRGDGRPGTGAALFARIAFNIAISNSDDHLRNHAAFWDGHQLQLTPAFDLSPCARSGDTSTQAIPFGRHGEKNSNFAALISQAAVYDLTRAAARGIVDRIITTIEHNWVEAADRARLPEAARNLLWRNQFLNRAASYDLPSLQ
jgi:serine/threonine-protein kinase HipA